MPAYRTARRHAAATNAGPRDGSTLLIVMVLLGMLSLIGFLFYTFAAQERSNATYFADSQKNYTAELDPDSLFDWSLQQLIVGPDDSLSQTVLAGKRHSMIPNLFGRDIHPYNSAGIRLASNNGLAFVDQNYDNTPDGISAAQGLLGQLPLELNDSAVVNSTAGWASARNQANPLGLSPAVPMPDPGVDYTYPDINSLFLAYKGFAVDANGNTVQVIIPSFHRPQLLRTTAGQPVADWYTNATYGGRILRPHPSHQNPSNHPLSGNRNRYPQTVPEYAGDPLTTPFPISPDVTNPNRGLQGVWSLTGAWAPGPTPLLEYDVDNDGDLIKEGVWLDLQYPVQTDSTGRKFVPLFSFTVYDADALFNLNVHGNLGRLPQLTAIGDVGSLTRFISTSNQAITPAEVNPQHALNSDPNIGPDFSGTAIDLDNATKQYQYQFGGTPSSAIQMSNLDWYRLLTGTANFQSATTFNDLYPGRYGEDTAVLYPGLQYGVTNGGSVAATPVVRMPFPGETGIDDNWNRYEGQYKWELQSNMPGITAASAPNVLNYTLNTPQFYPANLSYYASYPYGQPLDFKGDGTTTRSGTFGTQRLHVPNTVSAYNSMKFPQYVEYDNPGGFSNASAAGASDSTNLNSVDVAWRADSVLGLQMIDRNSNPLFTGANQGPYLVLQTDEDSETISDPAKASRSDSIFGYGENAALHLSATDRGNLSLSSRVRTLMPFNLSSSTRADGTAQRFTTASWDRKQFGHAGTGVHRPWEFSDLYDASGTYNPNNDGVRETFPPTVFDTANSVYLHSTNTGLSALLRSLDPFRAPVRKLLELSVGNTTDFNRKQFRLSINHLTSTDGIDDFSGNVIQRGITPHQPNLTAAPVVAGSQEFRARRDRQQMARDIYVMLYVLGGGLDDATSQNGFNGTINTAPNLGYLGDNAPDVSGNRNLYTDRQLREMAQFAVNIVDALDSDHVMTKFEYDRNLGNGWGDSATSTVLDDNPYTNEFTAWGTGHAKYDPAYPEDSDERGVVYGVEAQEMTFSELLAIRCDKMEMPAGTPYNHSATEHNDGITRYFTYVELRNISPKEISFSGRQWRVRAVPYNTTTNTYGLQRYVQFNGGTVGAGDIFTFGNAGEVDGSVPTSPNHSRFRCDNTRFDVPTVGAPFVPADPKAWIAPSANAAVTALGGELQLDLLAHRDQTGTYKFQLVDPGTTPTDFTDDTDVTNLAAGTDGAGRFFNSTSTMDPDNDAAYAAKVQPTFILERRQYPDRPFPTLKNQAQEDDNPWIPVDQFTLPQLTEFSLLETENMRSQYDSRLQQLLSKERAEPLNRTDQNYLTAGIVSNSLMAENSASTANPFNLWQVVYDRPFASPVELLQLPLYGPHNVTNWVDDSAETPLTQLNDLQTDYPNAGFPTLIVPPTLYKTGRQIGVPTAATAGAKILQPQDVTNIPLAPGSKVPAHDNRWYRMFEFFEVPTRTHRQLGNPLEVIRQPGKINLNGIRHPDVIAGLLDDTDVMRLAVVSPTVQTINAQDGSDADPNMPGGVRDWWVQFLQARDGRRTYLPGDVDVNNNPIVRISPDNVTGLFLPGLADSSPFRSFSSLGFTRIAGSFESPETALDHTIYRRLPYDMSQQAAGGDPLASPPSTFNVRHLWEVGQATQHQNSQVDALLRDKLLAKVHNNSTTRSHVFLTFVSIQLFEADDSAGAQNVRIGGPLTNTPVYRGFFVIDRSNPEEAYDPVAQRFTNYRSMVKFRQRIE